jgi:hypothetical protein
MDFADTQNYHTSIVSSISSSLCSYNTATCSCQTGTGVVRVALRLKHTQSHPHLLDPTETYVSLASSHGLDGAAEEYTKTHSRLPSDAASAGHILIDYANSLEHHQDPPTRGGLPIMPSIKITTLQPRQPPAALMSPPILADSLPYESGIIRTSGSCGKVDVTKIPSQCSHHITRLSDLSLGSSPPSVIYFHWNSIGAPVMASDEEDQLDQWLTLGQSSLSPTRQRTFGDQSLQSFISQTSPTEQSVTINPCSSKLLTPSPFGEQAFNIHSLAVSQQSIHKLPLLKVQEEAEEDNCPVDLPFWHLQHTVVPLKLVECTFADHVPLQRYSFKHYTNNKFLWYH